MDEKSVFSLFIMKIEEIQIRKSFRIKKNFIFIYIMYIISFSFTNIYIQIFFKLKFN